MLGQESHGAVLAGDMSSFRGGGGYGRPPTPDANLYNPGHAIRPPLGPSRTAHDAIVCQSRYRARSESKASEIGENGGALPAFREPCSRLLPALPVHRRPGRLHEEALQYVRHGRAHRKAVLRRQHIQAFGALRRQAETRELHRARSSGSVGPDGARFALREDVSMVSLTRYSQKLWNLKSSHRSWPFHLASLFRGRSWDLVCIR